MFFGLKKGGPPRPLEPLLTPATATAQEASRKEALWCPKVHQHEAQGIQMEVKETKKGRNRCKREVPGIQQRVKVPVKCIQKSIFKHGCEEYRFGMPTGIRR